MTKRILRLLVVSIVLATVLPAAVSAAPRVIQSKHLVATSKTKTWQSRQFDSGSTVYVHIYVNGVEVHQRYISGCSANYRHLRLIVRLRVTNCSGPGSSAYRLIYRGLRGPQVFRVRLTTSGCDPLPQSECRTG